MQAIDGSVGRIDDFIADDETWNIRYFVVDIRGFIPGRKVLLSPNWTKNIVWEERTVYVDLKLEQVKSSPLFDPSEPINRQYKERICDYYGRPKYG